MIIIIIIINVTGWGSKLDQQVVGVTMCWIVKLSSLKRTLHVVGTLGKQAKKQPTNEWLIAPKDVRVA